MSDAFARVIPQSSFFLKTNPMKISLIFKPKQLNLNLYVKPKQSIT